MALLAPALMLALAVPIRRAAAESEVFGEREPGVSEQQETEAAGTGAAASGWSFLELVTVPCRTAGDAGAIVCAGLLGVIVVAVAARKLVALVTDDEAAREDSAPATPEPASL